MNLYEIAENLRELADLADSADFDEETIRDTLEALEGDLTTKADNIGKLSKMLTRQADTCELEATRLKDRAAQLRKRNESVLGYLQACMVVADVKRVENSLFNISLRKLPPVVQLDEELLPKKWLVVRETFRPDKTGIKAAIEAGQEIRGATLVTDRQKLYIR
ncbi:MAG: siphovirus Gp157 family protein [Gammaproteobacteria bacterium]|nr:siphovirus Gp157 family protein [Gammaproteobacteria bacterium]